MTSNKEIEGINFLVCPNCKCKFAIEIEPKPGLKQQRRTLRIAFLAIFATATVAAVVDLLLLLGVWKL